MLSLAKPRTIAMVKPRKKPATEQEVQLISTLSADPVLAVTSMFSNNYGPLKLPTHQRIMLRTANRGTPFNLWVLSRGMGKSTVIGMSAIHKALFVPNIKVGIISSSYRQAQNIFAFIEEVCENSPYVADAVTYGPTRGSINCKLKFSNGSSITALPLGDGSKVRGERFHVLFIDEAPHVPSDIIDAVLIGMLATKADPTGAAGIKIQNQIFFASTAYFQFNHFYKKYRQYNDEIAKGNDRYVVLNFPMTDAPPGFLDLVVIEEAKKSMSQDIFNMEYMNYFIPDSGGFFPASLLEHSTSRSAFVERKGNPECEYVLGIDPATDGDANIALAIVKLGYPNKLVNIITMGGKRGNVPIQEVVESIRQVARDYNIVRIAMDQGGGGSQIRDLLKESTLDGDSAILPIDLSMYPHLSGRRILDVVHFSSRSVNDMNYALKADLENHNLVFPYNLIEKSDAKEVVADEDIHIEIHALCEEMRNIIATPLKNNYFNFDTADPRRQQKDRYSALLLANKAARDYKRRNEGVDISYKAPVGFWVPMRIGSLR